MARYPPKSAALASATYRGAERRPQAVGRKPKAATTEMFKGFAGLDKGKTFRPRRHHKAGTKRYELHKYAQATLGAGNLHDAVTLPDGEDVNEWLAVNTVDFFNEMCAPLSPRGRRACLRLTPCVALVPQQSAVRHHRRVLHRDSVPCHVCRAEVRVHVGRRADNKEADQLLRPALR